MAVAARRSKGISFRTREQARHAQIAIKRFLMKRMVENFHLSAFFLGGQ